MDLKELDLLIQNDEIEQALAHIETASDLKEERIISYFIILLEATKHPVLRNQIAVKLSDMRCQRAVAPIIRLLNDSKTNGNKGTLLYSLENLDYTDHFEILFDMLITGNFEVSRQAYMLIEQVKDKLSIQEKQLYKEKILNKTKEMTEKNNLLEEAVICFEL